MKASGRMTSNTDRAKNSGMMDPFMKESMCRARNMASESIAGMTVQCMKASGRRTRSRELGLIPGLMADGSKACGLIIIWTA